MSFTLTDLRTRVYNNIGRDDIPNTASGLIDTWINDAQRQICRAHNFAFMETKATQDTTDEQRNYALPTAGDSNWTKVPSSTTLRYKAEINCFLLNADSCRVPLIKGYRQHIEDRPEYRDTTNYGRPRHYSIQRGYLDLEPAPDHGCNSDTAWVIHFEYYGFLADLTVLSSSNGLTNDYPDVIETLATSLGFKYIFEAEKADFWEMKARGLIQDMITEDMVNKHGTIELGMEPRDGSGMYPRSRRLYCD